MPLLYGLHTTSDALIAASYVAITVMLVTFYAAARRDLPFGWICLAFGAFIATSGGTYIARVLDRADLGSGWTAAVLGASAGVQDICVVAAAATAAVLPFVLPRALALLREARQAREVLTRELSHRGESLVALASELARRGQSLREALAARDEFLSCAAHDLRTPLTALLLQAELMAVRTGRAPDAPSDPAQVAVLVQSARRLAGLVDELLDVSRAREGRLVAHLEPLDLGDVVRELCARDPDERHHLVAAVEDGLVGAFDRTGIRKLLHNLMENAVKYSPEGGEVRVRAWREGSEVRVAVADAGIGVAPGDGTRIFDHLDRGSNVDHRRFPGLGFGLYICRSVVAQHGGRIWVESPGEGRGSTFHVALPDGGTPRGAQGAEVEPGGRDAGAGAVVGMGTGATGARAGVGPA